MGHPWGAGAELKQQENAGRVSSGHSEPRQCQIQKTLGKWDLIFRGQGEKGVAKSSENQLNDQARPCSG